LGGVHFSLILANRVISVFSTGTEMKVVSGFSGIDRRTKKGKGTRIGLICPQVHDPLFQVSLIKDK
jgi:hypothetical protein